MFRAAGGGNDTQEVEGPRRSRPYQVEEVGGGMDLGLGIWGLACRVPSVQ